MAKKARKYSVEFKQDAVRRMAEATTIVGLAEKIGCSAEASLPMARSIESGRHSGIGATQGPAARKQVTEGIPAST
jgi:transposase-like protein